MNRKGFTLIELLVVIAIIAILAAILFPVFSRVRLKAFQSSCMSNQKQIVLAIRMYAADWAEILPWASKATNGGYVWWRTGSPPYNTSCLAPYLSSEEVWFCPAQEGGGTKQTNTAILWPGNRWHGICAQSFYTGWNTCWQGASLSLIQRPTEMILIGDGIGNGYASRPEGSNEIYPAAFSTYWAPGNTTAYRDVGLTHDPPFWPSRATGAYPQGSIFVGRHFGKLNAGFLDGHVAAIDVALLPTSINVGASGGVIYRYLSRGSDGA